MENDFFNKIQAIKDIKFIKKNIINIKLTTEMFSIILHKCYRKQIETFHILYTKTIFSGEDEIKITDKRYANLQTLRICADMKNLHLI